MRNPVCDHGEVSRLKSETPRLLILVASRCFESDILVSCQGTGSEEWGGKERKEREALHTRLQVLC